MADSKICVDTDIVVEYLQGKHDAFITAILRFDTCITSITLFELESVATLTTRQTQLLYQVYLAVNTLPFDEEAARKTAQIIKEHRANERQIGLNDALVAGICIAAQVPLLTRKVRSFRHVSNLQLVTPDDLAEM
ncbi:MAG TPA: type II toxin-antitoxin system VapC family toxin [Caldilineaceae bacterium]|nr:type II toxin-antitoxin system VapC family toxin [Caldilineaceae bacterium]